MADLSYARHLTRLRHHAASFESADSQRCLVGRSSWNRKDAPGSSRRRAGERAVLFSQRKRFRRDDRARGRFDRQVVLDSPDVGGRRAILEAHARGKPLAPDLDLVSTGAENDLELATNLARSVIGRLWHGRIRTSASLCAASQLGLAFRAGGLSRTRLQRSNGCAPRRGPVSIPDRGTRRVPGWQRPEYRGRVRATVARCRRLTFPIDPSSLAHAVVVFRGEALSAWRHRPSIFLFIEGRASTQRTGPAENPVAEAPVTPISLDVDGRSAIDTSQESVDGVSSHFLPSGYELICCEELFEDSISRCRASPVRVRISTEDRQSDR